MSNVIEIKPAESPLGGWRVIVNGSTFMRVNSKSRATSIARQIKNGTALKDVK